MSKVEIKHGTYYGKKVTGTFELMGDFVESEDSDRGGFIYVLRDGRKRKLHVGLMDFIVADATDGVDMSELDQLIRDKFDVMELLVDGVISGSIKSLIISGAPGVGKSYTVDEKLRVAQGKGLHFGVAKGNSTALGIYEQLFMHSNHGHVLVLDDLDSIFDDIIALNLLKGALDTNRTRTISWLGDSSYLKNQDIPNSFEFNGSVIFITNMDMDAIIAKGAKSSKHFAAVVNRCIYLDLKIHKNHEILLRIHQVVAETDILDQLGIDSDMAPKMLGWIDSNVANLRSLSLRTVIHLAEFIRTVPEDWEKIARATMLKAF